MSNKLKVLAYALPTAVMGLTSALAAHAAAADADADVLSIGQVVAASSSDNALGGIKANIGYVAIVFGAVLVITLIMRLIKRAAR